VESVLTERRAGAPTGAANASDPHNPHLAQPLLELGASVDVARVAAVLVHGRRQAPEYMRELVVARLPRHDVAYRLPRAAANTWYPEWFLAPVEQNQPWLDHSLATLDAIVGGLEAQGFERGRQVLVGFSQGGCVVAEYVLRHPARYGGVVVCTGGLAGPPRTTWDPSGDLAGTPMLVTTSERDPWVPPWRVFETVAVFERMGAAARHRIFPGGDHTVRRREVEEITQVLDRVAAARPA
jgi:predicted esterase